MPRSSPIQTSFSAGEFGPLTKGRVDADVYKQGLDLCQNYLPLIQGGLTRRPGTSFVEDVKTASEKTRLVSFEFSTTQAYILEFGNLYVRFYKDHAQITSGGPAVEIATPWTTAQIFDLKFAQSADVLYVVHPLQVPRKITRTSDIDWTITSISFTDGPYLLTNFTTTTLTPSAATGNGVTLTASSIVGINGGDGFKSTDVGRSIRLKQGALFWLGSNC